MATTAAAVAAAATTNSSISASAEASTSLHGGGTTTAGGGGAGTSNAPVVKNLLIKDASGNTQLIEVIQTAPGKFMTASGHSIKTSTAAGGVKTIIRTSTGPNTTSNAMKIQPQASPQTVFLTSASGTGSVTPVSIGQGGQIIRTTATGSGAATMMKGSPARQVVAIQSAGGLTPILKTIKSEFGTPQQATFIQPRPSPSGNQTLIGAPYLQVIQAGNQRLLLTQTPNGPQLTPITTITQGLGGQQQIATIVSSDQASPGSSSLNQIHLTPTLNLSKQSFISPILDHTGARKRVDFPSDVSYESKRRKAEKGGKGLRHFSMKVCEKVRTKGITTYNEVADELVNEFASPNMGLSTIEQQFDQKNIRRRVYDALNVLMAMNIISKEKKEIKWLGLPTNSMQECTTLEKDRQKRIERLKVKTQQLHDLIIQQVAFKQLVERNKQREKESGPPPPHGSIHLPFLIVNTAKNTVIDCSISNDKMEYLFNFDGTFEIHDDIEVLKRMGLALGLDKGECSDEDILKAKSVLPKALEMYIDQIGKREDDWTAQFGDLEYEDTVGYYPQGTDTIDGILNGQGGESVYTIAGVDDLEMQAAVQSLQGPNQSNVDDSQQPEEEEEDDDSFVDGDENDEDDGGLSD